MRPKIGRVTRSSVTERDVEKRSLSEEESSDEDGQVVKVETRRGKRLAAAVKIKQENTEDGDFGDGLRSPPAEDVAMLRSGWAEGDVPVVRSRRMMTRNGASSGVLLREERDYCGDRTKRILHYEAEEEDAPLIRNFNDLSATKEVVRRVLRSEGKPAATRQEAEDEDNEEFEDAAEEGQEGEAETTLSRESESGAGDEARTSEVEAEGEEEEQGLTLKPLRMENPCYAMCLQRMEDLAKELPALKQFLDVKEKSADAVKQMADELTQDLREGHTDVLDDARKEEWKSTLQACLTATEEEEQRIREILGKVYQIRTLREEARSIHKVGNVDMLRRGALMIILHEAGKHIPLYVGEYGQKPPTLVGKIPAMPNHVAEPKEIVAALVKSEEDGEDNWILAEVVSYNAEEKAYSVRDVDEEEKEEHMVPKDKTVPLPRYRADPDFYGDALYSEGEVVYALYPQTTCFYRAKITYTPRHPEEEYELVFEDSMYSSGYSPPMSVPQRYVISIPTSVKHTVSSRRARAQMRLAEHSSK